MEFRLVHPDNNTEVQKFERYLANGGDPENYPDTPPECEFLSMEERDSNGNLFYRYREGKKAAEVIGLQRSQFNYETSYSFTMNVGLVKAANFGADKLTAALVKSAPQMYFERSGILCHGFDLWYTFSLKDRHGKGYVRDTILPDLERIVAYLENQI